MSLTSLLTVCPLETLFFIRTSTSRLSASVWKKKQKNITFRVLNIPARCRKYTEKRVNHFLHKPLFLCVCSANLLKTLWKKEKVLVTSNFSFFPQCYITFQVLNIPDRCTKYMEKYSMSKPDTSL